MSAKLAKRQLREMKEQIEKHVKPSKVAVQQIDKDTKASKVHFICNIVIRLFKPHLMSGLHARALSHTQCVAVEIHGCA